MALLGEPIWLSFFLSAVLVVTMSRVKYCCIVLQTPSCPLKTGIPLYCGRIERKSAAQLLLSPCYCDSRDKANLDSFQFLISP